MSRSCAVKSLIAALAACCLLVLLSSCTGPMAPPIGDGKAPDVDPESSVDLVDKVVRKLEWGSIAFNAPPAMKYHEAQSIELLLSPTLSADELQTQLEEKTGADSARVKISNRMEAKLRGTGFSIEGLSPSIQAIPSDQTTRWKWNVTPTDYGTQHLYLALSAHIKLAGDDTPFVVKTFERTFDVQITVPQQISAFVQGNWQWLWAAILLPAAGYLWKRWKEPRVKPKGGGGVPPIPG
jgi:hypothetical protein